MRKRFDKDGKLIRYHQILFDNIPDDYQIRKTILEDGVLDLSYLSVMKYLRTSKVFDEFEDDKVYSSEILSYMALDYINSALFLRQGVVGDRGKDMVSYYVIPCAYLCKHAIELKLKQCLLSKGEEHIDGHNVLKLWEKLDETEIPHYQELYGFLIEVDRIDHNEMALRYGISKSLTPLQEDFKFDVDNLLTNAMFLFNIVDEYVICKQIYNRE